MHPLFKITLSIAISVFFEFILIHSANAQELKRVLVIHSYHGEYYWTSQLKQGIDDILQKEEHDIQVFHEFLDAKRYPYYDHKKQLLSYLTEKFQDKDLSALMVTDDAALRFVRSAYHDSFFEGLPVVFSGVNRISDAILKTPWLTGVFENRDVIATIREAARQVNSKKVVVIINSTLTGQAYRKKINAMTSDDGGPELIVIEDMTNQNITDLLKGVPPSTPIVLFGQLRHETPEGHLMSWPLSTALLSDSVPNPIYSIATRTLGKGSIGGLMLDGHSHAAQAVGLLTRILEGESVENIPAIQKAKNTWLFDASLFEKYNINKTLLPESAVLLNDKQSFYTRYKRLVWLTIAAFAAAFAIISLLGIIVRRSAATQKMLQENEARYKDLAYAGANIFWETDKDLRYCYMSGDMDYLYGFEDDRLIGKTLEEAFKDNANFHFPWNEYQDDVLHKKPLDNLTFSIKYAGQSVRIFQLNAKPIFDRNKIFIGYRGIKREVTEEHHLSEKIAYQASYDSLTGLINRREFNDQLEEYVKSSRQSQNESVLCFLDLDRFKLVNDTVGHLVGDALLSEIAKIFQSSLRQKDIVGRLGGDEFGFILIDTPIHQAKHICNRLIQSIDDYRFRWNDRVFSVGLSVGMVSLLHDSKDAVELLSKADFACYQSKEQGRGRLSVVGEAGDISMAEDQKSFGYLANIAQAIEQEQFYLVKQPIKTAGNEKISHYELLLRYNDENGQAIPPSLFIPQAERHGVITLIDRWVIEHIFANYYRYFPGGDTVVSINLSGISMSHNEFVAWLKNLVNSHIIPPEMICFEVTETAAISQLSQALEFMHDMRALGVRFALDDFGSGVASFGYLKKLPIDFLKIDGSLIRHIVTDASDRAIVSAVDDIAKMMGIKTIAEFVEDSAIESLLTVIGIDYVQGYGVGKPTLCEVAA